MLGAILLGHSEHVRRTPDLPSMVFCCKLLPRRVRVILWSHISQVFILLMEEILHHWDVKRHVNCGNSWKKRTETSLPSSVKLPFVLVLEPNVLASWHLEAATTKTSAVHASYSFLKCGDHRLMKGLLFPTA